MRPKKSAPKPISLNEEQRAVVNARSGVYCTMAGPGSGKTFACVQRLAALLQEGVSPDDILALSFTATGAKNLKTRVEEITGPWSINRTAGSMTLHSLALKFAEQERAEFPFELAEFPLLTEPNKIIGESARKFEVKPPVLQQFVSLQKRNRVRPGEAIKQAESGGKATEIKLALAYKDLDRRMRETKLLDFDSLMLEMVELMEKNVEVRSRHQYLYVTCDESQDCCKTDWQLLKLLTEKHGNLMCVGDPGQSVFGFRGASPTLFLEMEKMFPGTQKLFLATNYRSSKELVQFLREIGPVKELSEKFTTPNGSGPVPRVIGFSSSIDESTWVVNQIRGVP